MSMHRKLSERTGMAARTTMIRSIASINNARCGRITQ